MMTVEMLLVPVVCLFMGFLIGWCIVLRRRVREMSKHVKEAEGYYRKYQLACYKNAVRLELVRWVVERLARGAPYRNGRVPEWLETVKAVCDSHGLRVDGPFDDPLSAAAAGSSTVFPMGRDYWAVSEVGR